MAKQTEHGRLIAAAAKAALTPLGCRRKGQSRLWYSDQRFWIICVEFQPSNWSKGSFLNIGVRWLWSLGPGLDLSYRPLDFIFFESAQQFAPVIERMAANAAKEVLTLRERFKSLPDVSHYLVAVAQPARVGWSSYHAAIASGLIGDIDTSKHFFRQLELWPTDGYDWQRKLKSDSAALAVLLEDPIQFRSAILRIIEQQRKIEGLPHDPRCLDDATGPIIRL
jgi:hypothetical protein